MQLFQGVVSRLLFATETSGGPNGSSTSYVATFQVDSSPVRLIMPDLMVISEGDSIAVAGRLKGRVLNAVAYQNLSNGALAHGPFFSFGVLGVICTGVGLATLEFFIGIPVLALGAWAMLHAKYLLDAYSAVKGSA